MIEENMTFKQDSPIVIYNSLIQVISKGSLYKNASGFILTESF